MTTFSESTAGDAVGWRIVQGQDTSPIGETLTPILSQRERERFGERALVQRLRDALLPELAFGELFIESAEKYIGRTV